MKPNALLVGFFLALGALPANAQGLSQDKAANRGGKIQYGKDILPILSANCFHCHGPDDKSRKAGLRLDKRELALRPLRRGGRAIVPGRPEQSELVARIFAADPEERMPPPRSNHHLSEAEKQLLKRWIAEGAEYQEHWAFVPPRRPPVPRPAKSGWARNPIDCFILARLEQEGLEPAPEADRYTLARRLSLDLTGLPPAPEMVDRFVHDPSPDAYEKYVDALLSSPAYGEHWAHVWLDLARYADSNGYATDNPRTIWKYRDWVIAALNRNLPFDQFTIEQLAGDLLPHPREDQLIATAFHRNTLTNDEGGTDDEEFRVAAVVDRVNTTLQVWMGITIGCAQCHDHKYDPISQEEYFRLFAIFNQTEDSDKSDNRPNLITGTPEQLAEKARLEKQLAAVQQRLQQKLSPAERQAALKEAEALRRQLAALPVVPTPIMRELPPNQRRVTRIHIRGNFLNQGKEVTPGVPAVFPPLPADRPADRLALARWLVHPRNPLTARVTVNRYWEQLFGIGLMETPEDWGIRSKWPNHPELLDWLAVEFQTPAPQGMGWDVQRLLRLLVTSATYRQSSRLTPALQERDPDNRLFARGPCFRSSAEVIRDQALFVSGLLNRKMYGPPVRPPRPKMNLTAAFGGGTDWEPSPGGDRHRRALYTEWRRTTPYPSMVTFDAPNRNVCTLRRPRTNTPLQALVTLNDPCYVEAAQVLARRLLQEGGPTADARAAYGFRLCLVRPPRPEELHTLVQLYQRVRAEYASQPEAARRLASDPLGPLPPGQDPVELAAWTVVGNVLLNLDEFLMKR
jgi:mono/diheme cytochrome c family protein